jgi:hypothetical protein
MVITNEQLQQVTGQNIYDGSLIHNRFAYKFFKKDVSPSGNIVAFVAPMEVTANLIDLEDALNRDFIYSDSAINFVIELPLTNLFGGVAFQRLFNAQLGSLLSIKYLQKEGYVDGDDIMIRDGEEFKKASVSIAAEKNGAILIHVGINIKAGDRAPSFAYSTELTDVQADSFMKETCNMFYEMVHDIFVATTKVVI